MRTRIPQIPFSIIPCGNPIRVTIMATSPLRTMPNPIIREYFPDILKKFCRNPAANNLGNNSINSKDNQKSDSGGSQRRETCNYPKGDKKYRCKKILEIFRFLLEILGMDELCTIKRYSRNKCPDNARNSEKNQLQD
jgi:hypothetical protein